MSEDAILRVSKDDALADLLIAAGLGEKVRFDHSLGHWLIWNGVRWKPDRVTQIYDEVRLIANDLMAAADDQKDPGEFRKMLLPLFDSAKKATVLKSLAARESIRVTADQFDQDPYLIGFENGILDLRSRTFDANPPSTTLITKSSNIQWNPDADCPAFDAFMYDIMGDDEELVLYLLTLLGYSLFGLQSEQKFWLWVGRGANGKGVLARTILRTLGDYGSAPSSALYMKTKSGAAHAAAARPEIIKLLGMRFTAMSEPPGQQFDEQLLKSHTGEDVIVARDLYRGADHMLSFAPTHKIVFLANEAPKTEDVGISMRRRARMVRFEQDYSGARGDKLIEERLGTEVEGIAQRLASFALGWYENGLPEPTKIYQWSREYIEENDPIAQFIEDECLVAPEARTSATVLWTAYRMWEGRQGEVDRPLNRTQFGTLLGGRFRRVKGDSSNIYIGVRVRSNEDTTLDEPDAA